ncbi:L,D-transpeptidase family protein [Bacillus sp. J37]|uniref:L,D-transpeptidase family protein n=1 Tax=Bacillus sp. J37 TaxID=935837 RepID=UPI0004B530D8|nr:L,D-transpeptidase family protein [Bacillus sp. J37]
MLKFRSLLFFILFIGLLVGITTKEAFAGNENLVVVKDDAPLYVLANHQLKKVMEFSKGATIKHEGDYGKWYKVKVGREIGFINKQQVKLTKSKLKGSFQTVPSYLGSIKTTTDIAVYDNSTGKLVLFGELMANRTYPVVKDYGNWLQIAVGERIVYIYKSNVINQFTKETKMFKVDSSSTPVYINKNGKLVKIATLHSGTTFQRTSDYGNWHKITYAGQTAFIYNSNVTAIYKPGNSLKESSNKQFTVKRESPVYVRKNNKLVQMSSVKEGTTVSITRPYGNWYEVSVANQTGYIYKSNLTEKNALTDKLSKQTKYSQMLVVTASSNKSYKAEAVLYEKNGDEWEKTLTSPAVLGKLGVSLSKKEGDKKSPVGLYAIGHGFGVNRPADTKVPFKVTSNQDYWIDDTTSSDYNKWVKYSGDPNKKWKSFERMTNSLYKYGLVVEYNTNPVVKGKGSAIFIHVWRNQTSPTLGCIALPESNVLTLLKEIDPKRNPAIVIGTEADIMKTL